MIDDFYHDGRTTELAKEKWRKGAGERVKEQFLCELQSRISQHHMQKKSGKGIHVFAEWEISIQNKESRVQVEEGKKIDVKWTTHLITDIENKWITGGSFYLVYACVDEHTDALNRCTCT